MLTRARTTEDDVAIYEKSEKFYHFSILKILSLLVWSFSQRYLAIVVYLSYCSQDLRTNNSPKLNREKIDRTQ